MKKYYYGAVEITRELGLPPKDYMKVGYFLRLIGTSNTKWKKSYDLLLN